MKRILTTVVSLIIAITVLIPFNTLPAAADEPDPVTETDDTWVSLLADADSDPFGFVDEESEMELMEQKFPERFDLRDEGNVTPVRSQAPFGTCWSFGALAAAESSIINDGLLGADGEPASAETLDLSEKQLAYFSASALNDPQNSQNGEGQYVENFISSSQLMDRGGNAILTTSVLAQGIGPDHESSDPLLKYSGKDGVEVYDEIDGVIQKYSYSSYDDWSIPEELRFSRSYLLKESKILPAPAGRDEDGFYVYNEAGTQAIKQELTAGRAVQAAFCADATLPNQNNDNTQFISNNWAHYTYLPQYSNHVVTIVGWDDDYSRDNFLSGTVEITLKDGTVKTINKTPPADGAWLVKNSWGSATEDFPNKGYGLWGIEDGAGNHTGYFWMSYYDQSLLSVVTFQFEQSDDDDVIIDQLDYMPENTAWSARTDNVSKMSNAFTASRSEYLNAVSCFTTYPGTEVTYEIYLLDDYYNLPDRGIKIAEKTVEYQYGGFHKESINAEDILIDTSGTGDKKLLIAQYQSYSVVVTQKTPDDQYAVNFQYNMFSTGGGVYSFKGIINTNESFVFYDDEWHDYSDEYEHERMAELIAQQHQDEVGSDYSLDHLTFDNFPIKAYSEPAELDVSLEVRGADSLFYQTVKGSDQYRLNFFGKNGLPSDITKQDVSWNLLDEGEPSVETAPGSNSFRLRVTALGAEGIVYLYATAKNIGTAVKYIGVSRLEFGPNYVMFKDDADEEYDINIYVYTGEEIKPEAGVYSPTLQGMVPEDMYDLVYENNIKCGIAWAIARGKGGAAPGAETNNPFVIVPQKAEIIELTAGRESLNVKLKDQSESGLTGYRIRYREEGSEKWKEIKVPADSTEYVIENLSAGKKYEVSAAGYYGVPEDEPFWGAGEEYFGEESELKISEAVLEPEAEPEKPEEPETPAEPETPSEPDITPTKDLPKNDTYEKTGIFPDVNDPADSIYKPVYWAVRRGLVKGYANGYFGPDDTCTREQFVVMIWRLAGRPDSDAVTGFSDVSSGRSTYRAIQWAVGQDIIRGFSDNTFRPDDEITRLQAAIMLWRMAGRPSANKSVNFKDIDASASGFKAVQWGSGNGIIKGYSDNTFGPEKDCLRKHIVIFLYRYARNILGEDVK